MAFTTNDGSRHLNNANRSDVVNVKRMLRYINGSINEGIGYYTDRNILEPNAYINSDYAGDIEKIKSTTG